MCVVCYFFCFWLVGREDTEAVVRDVCLETAKTEENVRKYIKVRAEGYWFLVRSTVTVGREDNYT